MKRAAPSSGQGEPGAPGVLGAETRRVLLTPLGRRVAALGASAVLLAWTSRAALGAMSIELSGAWMFVPLAVLLALGCSLMLALVSVRSLRLEQLAPRVAFAGERFDLHLRVVSIARWRSLSNLVLHPGGVQSRSARHTSKLPGLAPGASLPTQLPFMLRRRGHLQQLELCVSTRYPLGLVEARYARLLPADLTALPWLGEWRGRRRARELLAGATGDLRRVRRDAEEFSGLRRFREGDDAGRIHWKVSARRGRLLCRETSGERTPPVCVVLSAGVDSLVRTRSGATRLHEGFESAVSLAATLLAEALQSASGARLVFAGPTGLRMPGERPSAGPATGPIERPGAGPDARGTQSLRGRAGLLSALQFLAHVEPSMDAAVAASVARALAVARERGERTLLVTANADEASQIRVPQVQTSRPRLDPGGPQVVHALPALESGEFALRPELGRVVLGR